MAHHLPSRAWRVARGVLAVRRRPPIARLARLTDPRRLASATVVPAGRNLGVAIAMLPDPEREEATAALLACRVLDAHEDLRPGAEPDRTAALLAAAEYLGGFPVPPPGSVGLVSHRDSERVDALLARRITDVRALIVELDPARRARVERLVLDVGQAMAVHQAGAPGRRAYGGDVLGRCVEFACDVLVGPGVAQRSVHRAVGQLLQMANDLRDGDGEPYGAGDHDELRRLVLLCSLAGTLGGLELARVLGERAPSRGARAAVLMMVLTTSAFLCRAAGAAPPVGRGRRLAGAIRASGDGAFRARLLDRVRASADACVAAVVADAAGGGAGASLAVFAGGSGDATGGVEVADLAVAASFRLVDALPEDRLTGDLPTDATLAMMLADHLVFDAVEPGGLDDPVRLRRLGQRIQRAAVESVP